MCALKASAFATLALIANHNAAAQKNAFEGIFEATLTRAGMAPQKFVFTRKGDLLRVENTTNKLEPINIVDLAANRLTITYPHNSTFVVVDLAKKQQPLPNQMPMMPPMPAMSGTTELKKGDKTKKIEGLDCALYTANERGENFEIWATNDSALFPFRLIERDYLGRRFGPQMLEETWPELLRNKSLFPLEASLKMQPGGMERLSFKVDKIDKRKIDNDALFEPPEKYIEIQAPQS